MNLDNIKEGMEIKNYKELCALLGEKVSTGNSKKSQFHEWERFFSFDKKGHKFIIKDVIKEPKDKKDGRKEGNNILPFLDETELLLLDLLLHNQSNEIKISNSKLLLALCMINPNYLRYVKKKEHLSEITDIDLNFIIDFYDVTNSTFRSAISTVNKRLENKRLVVHEQVIMVCFMETEVTTTKTGHLKIEDMYLYDDNLNVIGKKELKLTEVHREATADEKELIIRIEKHIMKNKYKCNNIQEIFLSGKASLFYTDVSRILFKELNIKKSYKAHRYTFDRSNLVDEFSKLIKKYKISDIQKNLNTKVMIRIDETNNKRYLRALSELIETDTSKKRINTRADEYYLDNLNFLSSNLIDKDNYDGLNHIDYQIDQDLN